MKSDFEALEATIRQYVDDETEQTLALERLQRIKLTSGNFMFSFAHELRTPLSSIIGSTKMLLDADFAPKLSEEQTQFFLQMIDRSGQQLLRMINTLLDYGRMPRTGIELSAKDVNLASLVDQLSECLLSSSPLITTFYGGQLVVSHDGYRLQQILQIAIDFIGSEGLPEEPINVTFRTTDRLLITIQGTKNIYEPIDSVYKDPVHGLAMPSELCRLMGGHLVLESERGQDQTMITIELPLRYTDDRSG